MKWGMFMVKKQKRNAGFSLIELIIVVAIMAVLVGVIAPQWIRYVERSRRVTDVNNAREIRDAFNRVLVTSDVDLVFLGNCRWNAKTSTMPSGEPTNVLEAMFLEMGEIPVSRVDEDYFWGVECENRVDGGRVRGTVTKVYLIQNPGATETYELWPDPSNFLQNGLN